MAKHTVILVARCTFEVSAHSYAAATAKAHDWLTEALTTDDDEPLKRLDVDAVTMMSRQVGE